MNAFDPSPYNCMEVSEKSWGYPLASSKSWMTILLSNAMVTWGSPIVRNGYLSDPRDMIRSDSHGDMLILDVKYHNHKRIEQ